jgi:hypothetical protein
MSRRDKLIALAAKLSPAAKAVLAKVCGTNGGGVSVRCKVGADGYGVPLHGPTRKLFELGLIQGKAGSCEKVVHTRDGLAINRALAEQEQ